MRTTQTKLVHVTSTASIGSSIGSSIGASIGAAISEMATETSAAAPRPALAPAIVLPLPGCAPRLLVTTCKLEQVAQTPHAGAIVSFLVDAKDYLRRTALLALGKLDNVARMPHVGTIVNFIADANHPKKVEYNSTRLHVVNASSTCTIQYIFFKCTSIPDRCEMAHLITQCMHVNQFMQHGGLKNAQCEKLNMTRVHDSYCT